MAGGRIIIIGGGITGCAAAWNLAIRGHRVTLIEKSRIAAMASGWTLGGVRQSGRHRAELALAQAAVMAWPGLAEELGHETGYARRGNLRLARSPAEAQAICKLVADQNRLGLDLAFLADNAAVRAIAPAVSENVLAASFCASDGYADPVAATGAFARAAETHGAQIETGVAGMAIIVRHGRIAGVETSSAGFMAADRLIVAAGVHTPALLATAGLSLPLRTTLVQVVQTEIVPACFGQVFGVANADCAGRQEPSGRFRYTSGVSPFSGALEGWTESSLAPSDTEVSRLRERVGQVLPVAADAAIARSWGGLIDLTPDALPVIDAPGAVQGLVIAAGFSGHGFGIGPVTGQLAAELATGLRPSWDIAAFRLDRFAVQAAAPAALTLHG